VPAIGMVITWLGYTMASWGYCVLRGYNVTLGEWANPLAPYSGAWPPAALASNILLPGESSTSSGNAVATANITGGTSAGAGSSGTPASTGTAQGGVTLE
jgi:hypothetical protein